MNPQKRRPATIIEVAKLANVSPATISRVLNRTAVVAPETEQRVREAITELGFIPHPAARQLVLNRTNLIGVLLQEISGAFFPPMLRGIEAEAREAGYNLLIYSQQNEKPSFQFGEHSVDGLITFAGSIQETDIRRYFEREFPVVLLHQTPPQDCPYPFVTVENKLGAEKLIDHLIEVHGLQRIVYLQGPESHEDSRWRERGYREALEAHQIAFDSQLLIRGGFDEEEAASAIQKLIQDGVGFDAVFAGDDDAAAGVIAALNQAGRRVPDDVAVVGFDDVPISRFITPPLTTVRAPIEQIGRTAVQLLVKQMLNQPCENKVLLPTELVIRHSCGCK
ncbi:MAG: LacI family DNA-binding transcriptional regulator [Anaerolineales bacterium]|nr:LacI family DNA-binding transcriptional regulator [Anaerolineales bacterium]